MPPTSWTQDFIILSEFCELEGPTARLVIPEQARDYDFDLQQFVLTIMAVEHSHQNTNAIDSLKTETEAHWMMSCPREGCFVYVQHITLLDIEARGYVRPLCISLISRNEKHLLDNFLSLRYAFTNFAHFLKRKNHEVFLFDLQKKMANWENPKMNKMLLSMTPNTINEAKSGLQSLGQTIEKFKTTPLPSPIFFEEIQQSPILSGSIVHNFSLDDNDNDNDFNLDDDDDNDDNDDDDDDDDNNNNNEDDDDFNFGEDIDDDNKKKKKKKKKKNLTETDSDNEKSPFPHESNFFSTRLRTIDEFCNVDLLQLETALKGIENKLSNIHTYTNTFSSLDFETSKNITNFIDVFNNSPVIPSKSPFDLEIGNTIKVNFCLHKDTLNTNNNNIENCPTPPLPPLSVSETTQVNEDAQCDLINNLDITAIEDSTVDTPFTSPLKMSQNSDVSTPFITKSGLNTSKNSDAFMRTVSNFSEMSELTSEFSEYTGETFSQISNQEFSKFERKNSGRGLLSVSKHFSTDIMKSIVFSMLTGRPIIIIGHHSHELFIRKIVQALSIFVVPNTNIHTKDRLKSRLPDDIEIDDESFYDYNTYYGAVVPWKPFSEKSLQLSDLQTIKLVGMTYTKKGKDIINQIPKSVENYISTLYFETGELYAPAYSSQATFLGKMFSRIHQWATEAVFLAHINLNLQEIAAKTFLYYHIVCLGTHRYTIFENVYQMFLKKFFYGQKQEDDLGDFFISNSTHTHANAFFRQSKVYSSDQLIIAHLTEVVKSQQAYDFLKDEKEVPEPSIKLDFRRFHKYKNKKPAKTIE